MGSTVLATIRHQQPPEARTEAHLPCVGACHTRNLPAKLAGQLAVRMRALARTSTRAQHLALVGDRQVVRTLRDMPHKMTFNGGKASLREHLLLLLPGGVDCAPAHLAILIVYPRPEQRLTKFCQRIRIG